jgi:hypothetical protein
VPFEGPATLPAVVLVTLVAHPEIRHAGSLSWGGGASRLEDHTRSLFRIARLSSRPCTKKAPMRRTRAVHGRRPDNRTLPPPSPMRRLRATCAAHQLAGCTPPLAAERHPRPRRALNWPRDRGSRAWCGSGCR